MIDCNIICKFIFTAQGFTFIGMLILYRNFKDNFTMCLRAHFINTEAQISAFNEIYFTIDYKMLPMLSTYTICFLNFFHFIMLGMKLEYNLNSYMDNSS